MGQRVPELPTFVDRAGCLGRDVAGDATRERELPEQLAHAVGIGAHVGVDLAVGPLQPRRRHQTGAAVAWSDDVHHVQVARDDRPVQVGVDEVEARRRAPVAEQPRLDVLGKQRLAQQRVVHQVDLSHREVVRRTPPGVDAPQLGPAQGTSLDRARGGVISLGHVRASIGVAIMGAPPRTVAPMNVPIVSSAGPAKDHHVNRRRHRRAFGPRLRGPFALTRLVRRDCRIRAVDVTAVTEMESNGDVDRASPPSAEAARRVTTLSPACCVGIALSSATAVAAHPYRDLAEARASPPRPRTSAASCLRGARAPGTSSSRECTPGQLWLLRTSPTATPCTSSGYR